MKSLSQLIGCFCVSACMSLFGCGSDTEHADEDTHEEADENHDGHDDETEGHGEENHEHSGEEESHDGHDHGTGGHGEDDHEHSGEEESLGTVTVGSTVFEVTIGGDLNPQASVHVDIHHVSGPKPTTIRAWIGEESGIGSLKGKGDSSDGRFHVDVEVPAKIVDSTSLWVELDGAEGKQAGSLPLK